MDLKQRLLTQWTHAAQDWIGQDQAVRTGLLDSWMLDAIGGCLGTAHLGHRVRRRTFLSAY